MGEVWFVMLLWTLLINSSRLYGESFWRSCAGAVVYGRSSRWSWTFSRPSDMQKSLMTVTSCGRNSSVLFSFLHISDKRNHVSGWQGGGIHGEGKRANNWTLGYSSELWALARDWRKRLVCISSHDVDWVQVMGWTNVVWLGKCLLWEIAQLKMGSHPFHFYTLVTWLTLAFCSLAQGTFWLWWFLQKHLVRWVESFFENGVNWRHKVLQQSSDPGADLHVLLIQTCTCTIMLNDIFLCGNTYFYQINRHNDLQAPPSFFTYLILSTV